MQGCQMDMERQDYEAQIAQLNETIRQNHALINRLMDQLKEQGQKGNKDYASLIPSAVALK